MTRIRPHWTQSLSALPPLHFPSWEFDAEIDPTTARSLYAHQSLDSLLSMKVTVTYGTYILQTITVKVWRNCLAVLELFFLALQHPYLRRLRRSQRAAHGYHVHLFKARLRVRVPEHLAYVIR